MITMPKVDNDLLMELASFSRSPTDPDVFCRSDPARSTWLYAHPHPSFICGLSIHFYQTYHLYVWVVGLGVLKHTTVFWAQNTALA